MSPTTGTEDRPGVPGATTPLVVDVFAEVGCPFTHVVLRRFVAERRSRGRVGEVVLRVQAWPLELVNEQFMSATGVAIEIAAIRAQVEPTMFSGFTTSSFPRSTVPAMAFAAAATALSPATGEAVSLELRDRLFERGEDIVSKRVLLELATAHGVPMPPAEEDADVSAVLADLAEGRRRGVTGSPHFFVGDRDFFCPGLSVAHTREDGYRIEDDPDGWATFVRAVFD